MVLSSWSVSRSKRNRKLILKIGVPLSGSGYPLIRSAPVRPRQGRDVGWEATPGVPSVNPGLPASTPPGSAAQEIVHTSSPALRS